MTQREVQDEENTRWTCVQAFAGVGGEVAEEAAERAESEDGTVTVVCTPSGGEQTVRLELPRDWSERMSDDELRSAIVEARAAR
jgi:hypothetical protein